MRKALIVGIDNYPSAPLNGCVKEAIEIANVLTKNGDGSPNFSTKLLIDAPEDVTRANLKKNIEALFAGKCDVALFYFSGHGIISSTGGYIVSSDAKKYDEGISMDDILKLANSSQATDKVVILDCCYSGAMGNSQILGTNASILSDGLTILTSCQPDEKSVMDSGSSVFTSLLIDGLQGGAADLRGNITPGHLYAYLDEALSAWEQRPIFKTNISKFVSLRQITPRVPTETLRKIVDYFKSPNEPFLLDPSYEFTSDSSILEHVAIFKDLQKFQSVGLVIPVDAEYMYFAAMESKSCRLTAIGYQYWRLVQENKL